MKKKDAVCFSCGKPCNSEEDRCHGCWEIVCVDCVDKYGHFMNGRHGKQKANKKMPGKDNHDTN